jgi:hypothetical protein
MKKGRGRVSAIAKGAKCAKGAKAEIENDFDPPSPCGLRRASYDFGYDWG